MRVVPLTRIVVCSCAERTSRCTLGSGTAAWDGRRPRGSARGLCGLRCPASGEDQAEQHRQRHHHDEGTADGLALPPAPARLAEQDLDLGPDALVSQR